MDGREQDRRRKARGKGGEDAALAYLEARGFRLVARNHHTREGELDLVVERGELLVFVEVRSRAPGSAVAPEETITPRKQRKVVLAALSFVAERDVRDRALRFDVVAITGERVLHLENAFDAGL